MRAESAAQQHNTATLRHMQPSLSQNMQHAETEATAMQATNPGMDPEQLRGLVAMGADDSAHASAVQRLLETPLASSTPLPGSSRHSFGPDNDDDPESAPERDSGGLSRSSSSRRRRASAVAGDGQEDGAPEVG